MDQQHTAETFYVDGRYLEQNPTWHVEDSPWKARQIMRMIARNGLNPQTICEVGCGAGEILVQMQRHMPSSTMFYGYEIAPQAFEMCRARANERLQFKLQDIATDTESHFDLMLVMDVIEHLEDYFSFLRMLQPKSTYTILNIPLDLSVQSLLRVSAITRKRVSVGHIHYFTKEIALDALRDAGYEVLDHFYAAGDIEMPAASLANALAKPPRSLLFALNPDFAARLLGGFSLMVLAR